MVNKFFLVLLVLKTVMVNKVLYMSYLYHGNSWSIRSFICPICIKDSHGQQGLFLYPTCIKDNHGQ